ncbi:transposase [Nitratireductor rhodophyticola]|uniref:IS66-like element accessory protein TnpA n=1 Tax=Nitratireductor rhodophyticola TaxID=2854036 RepID=UPI002AC8DDE7|nr:transposase [Nitratireductor rhodophyticola]WPZ14467.1 transposase [Nitratireductor rhodophyticola]
MDTPMEFLTNGGSGRVNRKWPDEVKARIVSESLRPGVTVQDVAERHGLKPNHLSTWRTLARRGKLILPAPEDATEFAAVVVAPAETTQQAHDVERAEIIFGAVTVRLERNASPSRIVAIARALAASA